MPKKPKKVVEETPKTRSEQESPTNGQAETVAGYFRKVFAENPKLLKQRSNDELFRRWLADHPGRKEVPQSVKSSLQNIKSVLRGKKGKKGKSRQASAAAPEAAPAQQPRAKLAKGALERLEGMIDDCLALARGLEVEALAPVIGHLRSARNGVVLQGQGGL
jgi:hypothetical protein